MGAAAAVGASESRVDGDHPVLLGEMCQYAFLYVIGIRFPCLAAVGGYGEIVNVPAYRLLPAEMPRKPLVKPSHGAADVAVPAGIEMQNAEGTHGDVAFGKEIEKEDVGPPSHCLGHSLFLRSASSICEVVLILMSVLLSASLDSEMSAISDSLRP